MNSFVPPKENIRVQTITYSDGSVQDSAIDFDSIHVRKKLKVDGDFTALGDTITNNIISNEVITNVIKYENDVDEFGNILEQTKAITDTMYDSLTQLIVNAGTVPNPLTLGGTTLTGGTDNLTLSPSTGGSVVMANNVTMNNTNHTKRQIGASYFNFLNSGDASSNPGAVGRIYQGASYYGGLWQGGTMFIQSFTNGGEIKFHTRNVSGIESFPVSFSYEYFNINVNDQCNIVAGTSFMQVLKNVSVIINATEKIEFRVGGDTPNLPIMILSPGNLKLLASVTLADNLTIFQSELGYLSGVTSSIQTQLNAKLGSGANTMQSLTINGSTATTNRITQSIITSDTIDNPNIFKYSEFAYDAGGGSTNSCLKISGGATGSNAHCFNFYPKILSGFNPINDTTLFNGAKRSIIGGAGGLFNDARCTTITNHSNQRSGLLIQNLNDGHASTEIWGGNNSVKTTAQNGITATVNIEASTLTLQHEFPTSTINSIITLNKSRAKMESGLTQVACDKSSGISIYNSNPSGIIDITSGNTSISMNGTAMTIAKVGTMSFSGGSSLGQRRTPAVYTQAMTSGEEYNVTVADNLPVGVWIIMWSLTFKVETANLIIYNITTGLTSSGTAFQYPNQIHTETFGDSKLIDSLITCTGHAILYNGSTTNFQLRAVAVIGAGPGTLTTVPTRSFFNAVCVGNSNT